MNVSVVRKGVPPSFGLFAVAGEQVRMLLRQADRGVTRQLFRGVRVHQVMHPIPGLLGILHDGPGQQRFVPDELEDIGGRLAIDSDGGRGHGTGEARPAGNRPRRQNDRCNSRLAFIRASALMRKQASILGSAVPMPPAGSRAVSRSISADSTFFNCRQVFPLTIRSLSIGNAIGMPPTRQMTSAASSRSGEIRTRPSRFSTTLMASSSSMTSNCNAGTPSSAAICWRRVVKISRDELLGGRNGSTSRLDQTLSTIRRKRRLSRSGRSSSLPHRSK